MSKKVVIFKVKGAQRGGGLVVKIYAEKGKCKYPLLQRAMPLFLGKLPDFKKVNLKGCNVMILMSVA